MSRLLLLLGFVACTLAQNNTVIDVLTAQRESILLDLIQAAGLTDTLKTAGPFTIFAPSNLALARMGQATLNSLKSDPTALANILKYHVVSGTLMAADLMVNEKQLTSLAAQNIRVNYYRYNKMSQYLSTLGYMPTAETDQTGRMNLSLAYTPLLGLSCRNPHLAVEGELVTSGNHVASNGVVHIIAGVMTPPNGTMVDILSADPEFSTLKAAVETAGLAAALNDGPYTLFAPTNAAFAKLGDALIQKLLANTDVLKSILLYHVLHGTLYSTGMHSTYLNTLEAVDRERLYASFTGRIVHVDQANVVMKDISATNGVIHAIDSVLVPSSLATTIKNL